MTAPGHGPHSTEALADLQLTRDPTPFDDAYAATDGSAQRRAAPKRSDTPAGGGCVTAAGGAIIAR